MNIKQTQYKKQNETKQRNTTQKNIIITTQRHCHANQKMKKKIQEHFKT